MITRRCPICKKKEQNLGAYAINPREHPADLDLSKSWVGIDKVGCFFPYVTCKNCGMLYCPNYLTEDQLNDYYSSMPNNEHSGEPDLEARTKAWYADKVVDLYIQQSNPEPGAAIRILEIGADNGSFMRQLRTAFETRSPFVTASMEWDAIEPNTQMHKVLTEEGARAVFLDLDSLVDSKMMCYDIIIGIHVLDHLLSPMDYMRKLEPCLSSNCLLAFVVHNEKSLLAKILGTRWPAFCVQHPQLFNKKTLSFFLKQLGCQHPCTISTPNYFRLNYLAEHLIRVALGRKVQLPRFPAVKLFLGNIMTFGVVKNEK